MIERLFQIGNQIARIFKPDRKADQAGRNAQLVLHLRRKSLVRRGRGMGGDGLGIAQIVGNLDDLQRILQLEGRFLATLWWFAFGPTCQAIKLRVLPSRGPACFCLLCKF